MERKASSSARIKIGRYNEKSTNRTSVTFKSKVVSRLHAELWCDNGSWFIKDIKSSSGTFINHIRLSPPGQESKPTMLSEGDTIQFGIDFRGGTEEVYRCVRTKVEVNRVFQKTNDRFDRVAHQKLKSLACLNTVQGPTHEKAFGSQDDRASTYFAECCICLFAIAPAQALFVAPCSHTYHFKCIRPLLTQHYPDFLCCVCRKYADLEASVEVESEAWLQSQEKGDPRTPTIETEEPVFQPLQSVLSSSPASQGHNRTSSFPSPSAVAIPSSKSAKRDSGRIASSSVSVPSPISIINRRVQDLTLDSQNTPRNEAGPFLLDGAAR